MTDAHDDVSELLDDDKLGGDLAPERPLGVGERLTPVVEQNGESFGHRVAREERDDLVAEESLGQLVRPGGDQGEDDEASEVAMSLTEPDETLSDFATEYEGVVPAEEAAMHLTDPPPMGDGDGYVDE
jgi:hypothetical protein